MRRFLFCSLLLLVVLLLASAMDAEAGGERELTSALDGDHDPGHRFFDHRYRPPVRPSPAAERIGRYRGHRPEVVEGGVRFHYRDRGYAEVHLQGSFGDWEPEPMVLDEDGLAWTIVRPLAEGRHRYRFVVTTEDGRERDRVDPSHSRRKRDEERGWLSVIVVDARGRLDFEESSPDRRRTLDDDDYDLELVADLGLLYQRVDGWVLSTAPRFGSDEPWSPALDAEVGYGFKSDRWQTRLSFIQPLTPRGRVRLVVAGYDRTDFTDRTGVGGLENTLSTLLFREDNRDYYRREGVSLGAELELEGRVLARLEYRSDEISSLDRIVRAGWGGREDFLPNPEVDEGIQRSVFARVRVGPELHHLQLDWELSRPGMSSDFDFHQLQLAYRARAHLGRSRFLDLRAKWGGNLDGELPRQKRYLLGGIGTVRGYRYQSLLEGADGRETYGGEQMFLATAEYVMGVHDEVMLAVFGDTGMVWADREADLDPGEWKSSVGLGVLFGDDDGLRLNLIKPLDTDADDLMLQGRLDRSF